MNILRLLAMAILWSVGEVFRSIARAAAREAIAYRNPALFAFAVTLYMASVYAFLQCLGIVVILLTP